VAAQTGRLSLWSDTFVPLREGRPFATLTGHPQKPPRAPFRLQKLPRAGRPAIGTKVPDHWDKSVRVVGQWWDRGAGRGAPS